MDLRTNLRQMSPSIFHWFRDRRRNAARMRPLLPDWIMILRQNVAHYCMLDAAERQELHAMMQVFLMEKRWEGCGGLELTDEIRVTIAAQACLLQLGLPHDYYQNVKTILIYPSTVITPEQRLGIFEVAHAPVSGPMPILGQAHAQGPVILVWDAVLRNARHPEQGHNLVYHEFAHKLDMLDGMLDGTPPIEDRGLFAQWVAVCSEEYLRLRELAEEGKKTFLDAYGATNEAEFFAVATEEFFDRPVLLRNHSPLLYRVLAEYYQQDPAARTDRTCPAEPEHI